ncbi:MAG TPA: PhoPQ-activated protein PqaA family protein [Pirellulaceae bacterium]|nr:PhoPQ-activated protein PqaA family protein [Pirellulaceae bacterium]
MNSTLESSFGTCALGARSVRAWCASDGHRPQVGRGAHQIRARSLFGCGTAALRRYSLGIFCVMLAFATGQASADDPVKADVPTALRDYITRPEKVFAWKLATPQQFGDTKIYDIALTSQQWQGIVWKHNLFIYEPKAMRHPGHVLLFITGGKNGSRPGLGERAMGLKLAELAGARVAMLHQVPNQPLLDGRSEDDLITETWLHYLKTGDKTWPLLFPMAKSAVKAMDAIEEIAKQKWDTPVKGFVVTGASKRGWTSWLTPVVDKRVIGTAPIVIDVLNFRPQMKHQLASWGKYSEQIIDYSSKGLINTGDESPRETQLRVMMDPYTYRKQLALPKLLINGTNDRYWVVDAMNLYWDDLVGPKYVLQVPNAGHSLGDGRVSALTTVAVFFQHTAADKAMPALSWDFGKAPDGLSLKIEPSRKPTAARLWVARSETTDFRESNWQSQPLAENGKAYAMTVERPEQGHIARYGELQFEFNGLQFSLCTLIRRD